MKRRLPVRRRLRPLVIHVHTAAPGPWWADVLRVVGLWLGW